MDWFEKNINFSNGLFDKERNYVVFGDMKYLERCDALIEMGLHITHVCEQNDSFSDTRNVLNGVEIISLRNFLLFMKDAQVLLISDHNDDVNESLRKVGFKNIIIANTTWFISLIDNTRAIYGAKDKISQVLDILEDEESKRVYKCVINAKLTLDGKYLEQACDNLSYQYFDSKLIELNNDEVFIDGGCFNCDTSLMFMAIVRGKFKKIYMFEPDQFQFSDIEKRVAIINDARLVCLNKGLYDKDGTVSFGSHPCGGSRIEEGADLTIATDYLDNITDEATFIKLDIEGAEAKALLGARKLIESRKPKLAISLYHKHEDLWELPLLIKSLNPSYKLYIRQYVSGFFIEDKNDNTLTVLDTICYAINEPLS